MRLLLRCMSLLVARSGFELTRRHVRSWRKLTFASLGEFGVGPLIPLHLRGKRAAHWFPTVLRLARAGTLISAFNASC
jgi:hypothetical protein